MAQDSLTREALEMWNREMKLGQLRVDDDLQAVSEEDARMELEVLLGRVESAAASLRFLKSKAKILTVPGLANLSLGVEQLELEDDSLVSETSKSQDSFILESIQMVADVMTSLVSKVISAESETLFQKERVSIGEEEIRRKTIQIEDLSLRLEELKKTVIGNKTVLDETAEMIEKLVEDNRRDREKALENEEELHRMKTECESLRNFVNTSTTLLSSELQFQTIKARVLVDKSVQLEGEKAEKELEVQKLMEENVKLTALLDKKEAQLLALNEQCKFMALNASNM